MNSKVFLNIDSHLNRIRVTPGDDYKREIPEVLMLTILIVLHKILFNCRSNIECTKIVNGKKWINFYDHKLRCKLSQ